MQHYTILIIDDKREQAKEIKKKIEALHPAFHADIANDASYALKGTYDAYLSDLMMPVHSGIEIGNMIYKENPDAIIILMSSLDNFAIERTQQFSAFTFLPKSFPYSFLSIMRDASPSCIPLFLSTYSVMQKALS